MKKFSIQILKKLWIVIIVIMFLFIGYNFIPSKKVIENNVVLSKVEKAKDTSSKDDDILIMAEKGGYLLYPENTKLAFDKVIRNSSYVDIIELDIRTTLDGYLVLIEDETINRLALDEDDDLVYVNQTELDALQEYNLGNNFKKQDGTYPYRGSRLFESQGLTLLTFESFLLQYKYYADDYMFLLDFQEIGDLGKDAVKKAIKILEEDTYEDYKGQIILSSNSIEMTNWLSKEYSNEYVICGNGDSAQSLLNACKYGFKIFNNPVYSVVEYDLKQTGLFGFKYSTVTKGFIKKIEEKNMALIFKGVNTKEDVEKVFKINGHVIGTGDYSLVNSTLKELTK